MSDTLRLQIGEILERAESELIRAVTHRQGHTLGRESLDRELREIRDAVLRMGAAVEEAIDSSLRALATADPDLGAAVIANDLRINAMQRDVSALITMAIATQQPVARDLRFLLALDHVSYELERIGDHARSVARHACGLAAEEETRPAADPALVELGTIAARQLNAILSALLAVDDLAARRVAAADDDIDDRYHRTFDRLLGMMREDSTTVSLGTHRLLVAHDLERIGDRVTNIAEDVVFLATGEIEDLNP